MQKQNQRLGHSHFPLLQAVCMFLPHVRRILPVIFCFPLFGGCDYFGPRVTRLDWKAPYWGGEPGRGAESKKTKSVNDQFSLRLETVSHLRIKEMPHHLICSDYHLSVLYKENRTTSVQILNLGGWVSLGYKYTSTSNKMVVPKYIQMIQSSSNHSNRTETVLNRSLRFLLGYRANASPPLPPTIILNPQYMLLWS